MDLKPVLLIAAGGTGGHMFPAQALAYEFQELGWNVVLVTDKRGIKFTKSFPEGVIKFVQRSSSLKFGDILSFPKAAFLISVGLFQALWIFNKIKPTVVIGFGGYPSFSAMLISRVLNIKAMAHEQNAVLGRVNRFFSRSVRVVACSFWPTKAPKGTVTYFTGNPIRNNILDHDHSDFELPLAGSLNVVVIGGSQGASIFSRVIPEAIEFLPLKLKSRLRIVQQARLGDCINLEKVYERLGVNATVKDFFQNIEYILSSAHLVIARAGASTIAEVLFIGRPLLLVPISDSIGNHQKANAQRISDLGAAILLEEKDLTGKKLSIEINSILTDQKLAQSLATNAVKNSTPDAIKKLRDLVLNILEGDISAR